MEDITKIEGTCPHCEEPVNAEFDECGIGDCPLCGEGIMILGEKWVALYSIGEDD